MFAYFNGRFLPQEEVRLPLHDAGFIFGATVTDLCRTFRHRLFRLTDHLARFRQSCSLARVPQPLPDQEIGEAAEELIEKNCASLPAEKDLVLVMFATPGPIEYHAAHLPLGTKSPSFGMYTFPVPVDRYAPLIRRGAHLIVPRTRQLPGTCIDVRIKHRSRLHWWIAEQEARQIDHDAWALLSDRKGNVSETAAANFLIVKNGVVCTPPRTMILGGISLLTVEEICREKGIPFEERPLMLRDCLEADEALLTGTTFCLAGVSRIGSARVPWPGKMLEGLFEAWNHRVGLDIRAQILSAD